MLNNVNAIKHTIPTHAIIRTLDFCPDENRYEPGIVLRFSSQLYHDPDFQPEELLAVLGMYSPDSLIETKVTTRPWNYEFGTVFVNDYWNEYNDYVCDWNCVDITDCIADMLCPQMAIDTFADFAEAEIEAALRAEYGEDWREQ